MYIQTAIDRHGFKIYHKYILLTGNNHVNRNALTICKKILAGNDRSMGKSAGMNVWGTYIRWAVCAGYPAQQLIPLYYNAASSRKGKKCD
jgi:hypothetical protein